MPLADDVNRVWRDFERYTGDGKPNAPSGKPLPIGDERSGTHNPGKGEIRNLLLAILQSMGDPSALEDILTQLSGKADSAVVDALAAARSLSTVVTLNVPSPGADNPNTLTATRPAEVASIPEVDGSLYIIKPPYSNTGPVTINGKPLHDGYNQPLTAGMLRANGRYIIRYSSFLDGYVLVTGGVMPSDLSEVGAVATLGVSPAVAGANLAANRQWLPVRTYDVRTQVYAIEIFASATGEIEIATFSGTTTLVKGDRRTVQVTKTGLQKIYLDDELIVQPGDRIGWWATPGIIRLTGSSSDGGFQGYQSNGSGDPGKAESFTPTAVSTNVYFSINFRLRFGSNAGALGAAMAAIRDLRKQQVVSPLGWPETRTFVILWVVGQSNGAGRGRTPSAFTIEPGRGYKYDPQDGIVHLVEPTGTDALAQDNGYVSFGSGAAAAMLAATQGRVGVIIVNSSVGATTIADWAAGGTVWANAQAQIADALADIKALGLNVVGAIGAFCQGEGNATSTGGTMPDYKAGVLDLLARMRTQIGLPTMRMLMVQTGTHGDGDTTRYQQVRQAQAELANDSDGSIIMAHAGARYFVQRGLMHDDLHYTTQGYDEIGSALGAAVAAYGIGLRAPALE